MAKPSKKRLDVLLVEKGLADSRSLAQSLILAGKVLVNDERIDKPGHNISEDAVLRVKDQLKYVGRGGLKLEKALEEFKPEIQNKIGIDVGASTGGFTDCALQNGAKKIYAFDAGHGQLHWRLQTDERVINHEKTNFRHLDLNLIQDPIDFAVMDVSFISITKLIPKIKEVFFLSKTPKWVVFLIKPQFEAGKNEIGKGGIVKDPSVKQKVIQTIESFMENEGFENLSVIPSPIFGADGNEEFLIFATFDPIK